MAEAPAYQSGLIAALRGGAAQPTSINVPGLTMMPNAPASQGSLVLFGGAPMTGNLMRPPSFPPMQGAMPKPPVQQQQTANFMGLPIPIPQELQANPPAYQSPLMTGNLMPVPQFAPAPDYVAPPPKPVVTPPPAPPYYETEDGYKYTINADGDMVPWYAPGD